MASRGFDALHTVLFQGWTAWELFKSAPQRQIVSDCLCACACGRACALREVLKWLKCNVRLIIR